MKKLKVIVAGTRSFKDYALLKEKLNLYLSNYDPGSLEIVSGKATGADALGEQYAEENGIEVKEFPADWKTHGKRAGYLRNKEMSEYADCLVAFWNGKSKGARMMIELARKQGLKVKVVKY